MKKSRWDQEGVGVGGGEAEAGNNAVLSMSQSHVFTPPFSFQTRKPGPVAKRHGDGHRHDRLRMWSMNPHGHPQTTQAGRVQLRKNRPKWRTIGE